MSLDTIREDTWNAFHSLLSANLSDMEVSQGDWTVLDKGKSTILISYPGGWEMLDGAHGVFRVRWTFILEVYVRHDLATELPNLVQAVDDVLSLILRYPTLNNHPGVALVRPTSADDPRWIFDRRGGGPHYVMQAVRLHIVQQVAISGGQYG